jgi:hypothetical protein
MFAAGGCRLIAFGRIGGSPYDTGKYSLSERSNWGMMQIRLPSSVAMLSNNFSMSPDSPP